MRRFSTNQLLDQLFTFDFGDGQSCADCPGLSILVDETAVERALLGLAAHQRLELFLDLRCEVCADEIHQRGAVQRLGIVMAEPECERRLDRESARRNSRHQYAHRSTSYA